MWSHDATLSVFLALLVGLVFFLLPLADYQHAAILGANLLASVLLISGSIALIDHAWARRAVVLLALGQIFASWAQTIVDVRAFRVAGTVLTALVLTLLLLLLLVDVYRPGPITRYRISGAVAAYVMLGLAWTYVYTLVELGAPGSLRFARLDATEVSQPRFLAELFYFSAATLTTVGYGDVVPVAPFARSLAMLEAICGQLFLATMIARLVSLRQPSPTRRSAEPPSGD
jgi:hypothetical protein